MTKTHSLTNELGRGNMTGVNRENYIKNAVKRMRRMNIPESVIEKTVEKLRARKDVTKPDKNE